MVYRPETENIDACPETAYFNLDSIPLCQNTYHLYFEQTHFLFANKLFDNQFKLLVPTGLETRTVFVNFLPPRTTS